MPTINQLSAVDQVISSDQVPIYSSDNGDARKASMATLLAFFAGQITANDDKVTQYSAPSATGFTVTINNGSDSIWLVLTPVAGYAAGTLTLPAVANCVDRQELLVNSTQSVTTLTVAGNGATVTGAPTTLAANAFFRLRFEAVTKTWYRVG
jgi:hypothetical protein